jgi:hypothetical protein
VLSLLFQSNCSISQDLLLLAQIMFQSQFVAMPWIHWSTESIHSNHWQGIRIWRTRIGDVPRFGTTHLHLFGFCLVSVCASRDCWILHN